MINDFNALAVIRCTGLSASFSPTSADYDQIVYATASCLTPNTDKRLTKKCTAFGAWIDILAACP
jgi:hypothetical protein